MKIGISIKSKLRYEPVESFNNHPRYEANEFGLLMPIFINILHNLFSVVFAGITSKYENR